LKSSGWVNTVDVAKQNENVYGQLFVDGELISLADARRPVHNPSEQADWKREA